MYSEYVFVYLPQIRRLKIVYSATVPLLAYDSFFNLANAANILRVPARSKSTVTS